MTLPTISPEDAKRLVDQGATLVDIRGAEERAREHIPGSHHGPLAQITNFAGVNAPIIFHCHAGRRTAVNAGRLKGAAGCEAYVLGGGIEAWKRAGLPVVADTSQPIEIGRQLMIACGVLVLLGVGLGAFVAPAFYVLAGLAGVGLLIGGLSGWRGMAKLLEVMPWNKRTLRA
jgi:rhodanese-related sulfurtransferase